MQKTKIFRYYAFGYNYGILYRYSTGDPIHGDNDSLVGRLETIFKHLEHLDLRVTLQASNELQALLKEAKALPADGIVDKALAARVREAIRQIDTTLDAELHLATAYMIDQKRYATTQLVDTPETLLGTGVSAALPALARFDFSEACNCIAFDRPTAAAFHLMRCVEGVLRDYYCFIVKRGRIKKLMWFDMLTHLRNRRDAPPKVVIDNLDGIRTNFRNPTQHPDARYDMDEAQDLLAVTIDAVNRIHRDRKSRSP